MRAHAKFALIAPSLTGGGAERVMSILASEWARREFKVSLITISEVATTEYPLDRDVNRVGLGLECGSGNWLKGLINNVRRVRALRSALRDCGADLIISFLPSVSVVGWIAARPMRTPFIVGEHTSPEQHRLPFIWRLLRTLVYSRASAIVAVTQRGGEWLKLEFPDVPIRVISNPLKIESSASPDGVAADAINICATQDVLLAAGRLHHVKGYDLLLQAFSNVANSHPTWRLVILGEGPERPEIEALVRRLHLDGRVLLPGFTSTPHVVMRHAKVFVMSSRYEGFPMALLEAMSCGLACVSFNCSTGLSELITDSVDGLLVKGDDTQCLGAALSKLIRSASLRDELGQRAKQKVRRYSMEVVMAAWDELFNTLGPHLGGTREMNIEKQSMGRW